MKGESNTMNNRRIRIVGGIVFFLLVLFHTVILSSNTVLAEDSVMDPDLGVNYVEFSDHIEILNEYTRYEVTKWVIPESINGKSVTVIREPLFNGASNRITEIVIPDSVTEIKGKAFLSFTALKKVKLSSSLTSIEESTFSNCTSLESIIIPNGVKEIGTWAFSGCTALKSVEIPKTCTVIGKMAFYNTTSLESICLAAGTTYIGPSAFQSSGIKRVSFTGVVVNNGDSTKYDLCTNNEEQVRYCGVGDAAFSYCGNLETVDLPGTLKNISTEKTFWGCTNLVAFKLHPGTISISKPFDDNRAQRGTDIFASCDKLVNIFLPSTLEYATCELLDWSTQGEDYSLNELYIHYAGTKEEFASIFPDYQYYTDWIVLSEYNEDSEDSSETDIIDDPTNGIDYITVDFGNTKMRIQWGDWLFWASPEVTNYNLAIAGCALSAAAEHSRERIETIMSQMGMDKGAIVSGNYDIQGNLLSPAYTIGTKEIEMEDESHRKLVVMTVRGTTSAGDLATDAYATTDGFMTAGDAMMNTLNQYTDKYLSGVNRDDIIYYVTGHSLGGATAIQVGRRINAQSLSGKKYVYAFAPPRYKSILPVPMSFIHQFINSRDIVPKMGGLGLRLSNLEEFDGTNSYLKAFYSPLTGGRELPGWAEVNIVQPYSHHCNEIYMAYLLSRLDESYVSLPGEDGSNLQYIRVFCPVDVKVYDNSGKLVARIENNTVDTSISDPRAISMVSEDKKYIIFASDDNYKVELSANGEGEMTYSVGILNSGSGEVEESKSFKNVKLVPGKSFVSEVSVNRKDVSDGAASGGDASTVKDYNLSIVDPASGKPIIEVQTDGSEKVSDISKDIELDDIPEDYSIPEGLWIGGLAKSYVYSGEAIVPKVNLYDGNKRLVKGVDYSVSFKNNTKAADETSDKAPTIIVTGKGAYKGKNITKKFTINKADISKLIYTSSVPVLNGKKASYAIYNNGLKLKGSDFTASSEAKTKWKENGSFSVKGKGNYEGELSVSVNIIQNANRMKVLFSNEKLYYDGLEKTPAVTVTDKISGRELTLGKDYVISTSNDITSVGKHRMVVVGINDYSGSAGKTYKILVPKDAAFTVKVNTDAGIKLDKKGTVIPAESIEVYTKLTADGAAIRLFQGRDYVVSYSNNKKTGKARYFIKGIGNYSGIAISKGEFQIVE